TERLALACCRQRVERPLHGALACSKRQRQARARPRLTVGEDGEHRRMLLFDGPREDDDLASTARRQRKSSLRRAYVDQRPKHRTKSADLDSQARAVRFIGALRSEGAGDEGVPGYVSPPRFTTPPFG